MKPKAKINALRFAALGIVLFTAVISRAQEFTEPGWFRSMREPEGVVEEIEMVENSGGESHLESLVSPPEVAEAVTPEIQALARGLENDPKRIFDYVHDHIRYVHYFGSKKGAQLTLLERSGNDFDQCALLVALLRSAGLTASYQFGTTYLPYERSDHRDYRHWIGTTKPNTNWTETLGFVFDLNNSRGFPFLSYFSGDTNDLIFHRIWVKLTLSGTNYLLDPAFKVSEPVAGTNLAVAMGLDTNQLMTVAGGTSTADYVQSLSESSLRNKLRDYTTNLLAYIQSNQPNASAEEILGGQKISPSASQPLNQGLPFTVYNKGGQWPTLNWDYIPTNLMATLKVAVDGTNQFLLMPQLQGQKLALTFSTNGLAQLWAEDDVLLQKQTSGESTVDVVLSVDHPHGVWNFTNNTLINASWTDHVATNSYRATNASYVLAYAFDADSAWLRQRQERLDSYRQQGLKDTSRQIVTETLNVMSLNWFLQTELMSHVLAAQQDVLLLHHHRFGRMAQEPGNGYYIDIYTQVIGSNPANGTNANDMARSARLFDLQSYFASATEHGLLEQMQSSNLVAASSVKMLQLANTNGQKAFIAKSSNWLAGANVRGQLANYDLAMLDDYINAGATLLLPQNGSNFLAGAGSWAGYGLVARGTNGSFLATLIGGGYHGGYPAFPNVSVDTPFVSGSAQVQPNAFNAYSPYVFGAHGADPVDMADGSFRLSATDLSLGQVEPRGMTFTRFYSPTRRFHNLAAVAHGWVHNYYLNVAEVSAPLPGLGDTTPAQMASIIVATKAAMELYQTNGTPKNWAVCSLIAKWGIDQLIGNAVSITLGNDTVQFIKQPNGTFTPPASSTMTLLKTNSVYWVQERHGNTLKFDTAGRLTNIVDQYNQPLTIAYLSSTSSLPQTVTDWKSRTLTFNYTSSPPRLASVTDSTGRTVSYGYTTNAGQLDLTSVTDPENKTSTFVYDTNHQMIATKDALNRVITSNRYDGFGRVIEQYSQGDTNQTWRLYWSGFVAGVEHCL